MKNEIRVFDNFELDKLSNDDCGFILWYNKFYIQPAIKQIETRLKTGPVLTLTSDKYDINISKPKPATTKVVNEIDWDAIVEFGKQHNFAIPQKPDTEKMQELGWVKECLEQTTFWKQIKKPARVYNGAIEIINVEEK